MYWDTLHQCMDFIGILSLTSPYVTGDNKIQLAALYDMYIDTKEILDVWKQNQLSYQRIIKEFYTSFNNILNYDKLMMLRDKIRAYLDLLGMLKKDESYNQVSKFIDECMKYNLCECIKNQMSDKIFGIADEMYNVLSRLQESNVANLVDDLRRIGLAIYYSTYLIGGNNQIPAFPFILSPGSFLGNVVQNIDLNKADPLADIIVNLQKRLAKKENAENDIYMKIEYINNNKDNLQKKVLLQTVKKYLTDKGINMNDNNRMIISNGIYGKVSQDKKLELELENNIQKNLLMGKRIEDVIIPTEVISKYVEEYVLSLKNQQMKNRQQNIERNQKINMLKRENLKSQKNDEESTIYSEPGNQRKLLEAMTGGNISVLPGNPAVISKWYTDIVRLSGLFNYTKDDYYKLANTNLDQLLKIVKLPSNTIDVIIHDYKLPSIYEIGNQKDYNFSYGKPDTTKKYNDQGYIDNRLTEIYGEMYDI